MADADVQGAVHAISPIEDDERSHRELREIDAYVIEDVLRDAPVRRAGRFPHPPEREDKRHDDDDERGQRFFQEVEEREIDPAAGTDDMAEEIDRVSAVGALEHHENAEHILGDRAGRRDFPPSRC